MELTTEIKQKLALLEEKYAAMGQDMTSYLDGLIHADYLTYWDYIHLDTLLSLQTPRTPIDDERIFIIYHQITELYFKLILQAIDGIADKLDITATDMKYYLKRLNVYFDNLISSFRIMYEVLNHEEFMKFRMSLLPSSGFQSVQYRKIEICSTPIINLVNYKARPQLQKSTDETEIYQHLYWKTGATELATGKKTLTLKQFEKNYSHDLIHLIRDFYHKNIWMRFGQLTKQEQQDIELLELMRNYDFRANVLWPLSHYKAAARHLQRDPVDIAATGGTNWQKYLPPKNQRILFFPELWTDEEFENWGKKITL